MCTKINPNSPWSCLMADTIRQKGIYSFATLISLFLASRTFKPIATLRLCQLVDSISSIRLFLPILKLLHAWATRRAGIDLSWRTRIGPGFCITHGWGLVINPETKIGSNVTIFHGATLGRRDRISKTGKRTTEYPIIEDRVWIGPRHHHRRCNYWRR